MPYDFVLILCGLLGNGLILTIIAAQFDRCDYAPPETAEKNAIDDGAFSGKIRPNSYGQ